MRDPFLTNPEVCALSDWLVAKLDRLPVRLAQPASPFMRSALIADTTFGALVPAHFSWRRTGMAVGDWRETLEWLHMLSGALRRAVDADDVAATHAACEAIVQWSADRNSRVGASAYLRMLGNDLPAYLRRAREALRLAAPDPTGNFRAVPRMNSALCKVHSLYGFDGLPVYESRVASTAAMLVELWRRDTGRASAPLPPFLRFPAMGSQRQRRLRSVFPDAADPGLLGYNPGSEIATAGRWANAAVRLGLLIEKVLLDGPRDRFVAFPQEPASQHLGARMAALTASLFVAGYDPQCFLPPVASEARRPSERAHPQ